MGVNIKLGKKRNIDAIQVSLYIFITYYTLPTLGVILPSFLRLTIVALGYVCLLLGIFLNKSISNDALFSAVFISIIILIVYRGVWSNQRTLVSYIKAALPFWIGIIYSFTILELPKREKEKILSWWFLLMIITSITTIIGEIRFPESSRLLASGSRSARFDRYQSYNIGGFGFVYSTVLAMPYYFSIRKEEKRYRHLMNLLIAIGIIIIIITQYSMAILLSIFVFVLIFITHSNNKAKATIWAVLVALAGIIVRANIFSLISLLNTVFTKAGYTQITSKLNMFNAYFKSGLLYGDSLERANLYQQSIESFRSSPFFGCFFTPVPLGGHSEFLDLLGGAGLIGLCFFIVTLTPFIKVLKRNRIDRCWPTCILTFIGFITLFILNPVFTSPQIGFVAFTLPALVLQNDASDICCA